MHVGYHLVRQLDRLWNGETLSVMSRPGFELPTFLWSDWSLFFYLNFDPPIPKLLKLFVIPDPFEIFLYMYPLNQLKKNLSGMNHMLTMISWDLFYSGLRDSFNILWKNIENELRVYLSHQRVVFQLPKVDFL